MRTMKRGAISLLTTLAVMIVALPATVTADPELDALLNEQRRRAQRRVYSERAVLDRSQEQVVDTGPSREELEIEAKFRAAEAERDARSIDRPASPPPPRPTPPALRRPDASRNWLTPAMLDEAAGLTKQEDPDDDPFAYPSSRPRERDQDLPSRFDSSEPVFQRMGHPVDPSPFGLESVRREAESLANTPTYSINALSPATRYGIPLVSAQRPEQATRISPFSPERTRSATEPGVSPFSPEAVRSAAQPPARSPSFGVPSVSSASPFAPDESGRAMDTGSAPSQRPIDVLRRSTPIHQDDPFNPDRPARPYRGLWE